MPDFGSVWLLSVARGVPRQPRVAAARTLGIPVGIYSHAKALSSPAQVSSGVAVILLSMQPPAYSDGTAPMTV